MPEISIPQIDKEFESLLPPLTELERQTLEENLKRDGCLSPLIVWGNILLDGHNRFEICQRLQIPYRIEKIHLESRIEALEWIISHQDGQRAQSWNAFNRSHAVLKCSQLIDELKAQAQARIKDPRLTLDEGTTGRTDEHLARLAKVGKDTLRKTQAVLERAPLPLIEMAQQDEISVNRAYQITKVLDTASETVKNITVQHKLTEIDTVKILAGLHSDSQTLQDVQTNGYIDAGDGNQVHITESPLKVRDAIAKRAQAYKLLSLDTKTNILTLYNTDDLRAVCVDLERHFGDRLSELIDELTARQIKVTS